MKQSAILEIAPFFGCPEHLGWTEEERRQIEAGAMPERAFVDRVFEQLEATPALFDVNDIFELNKRIRADQTRTAILYFLTMSGEALCREVESSREFAIEALRIVRAAEDEARLIYSAMLESIGHAKSRVTFALCSREDMKEIVAEAGNG